MLERYAPADLTPARRRMARIPEGADLIENPISRAPGFRIGNVFVLAGVPAVMQAMLDFAVKSMKTGAVMLVETIAAGSLPEGRYGEALAAIAAAHPNVGDRLLSIVQGRALQQPDRGARQGRRGGRRRAARRRGDDRRAVGRRRGAVSLGEPTLQKVLIRPGGCSHGSIALAKEARRKRQGAAGAPPPATKPFRFPGTSFIATRARLRGGSPPRARSTPSSPSPAAASSRPRSSRGSSRSG